MATKSTIANVTRRHLGVNVVDHSPLALPVPGPFVYPGDHRCLNEIGVGDLGRLGREVMEIFEVGTDLLATSWNFPSGGSQIAHPWRGRHALRQPGDRPGARESTASPRHCRKNPPPCGRTAAFGGISSIRRRTSGPDAPTTRASCSCPIRPLVRKASAIAVSTASAGNPAYEGAPAAGEPVLSARRLRWSTLRTPNSSSTTSTRSFHGAHHSLFSLLTLAFSAPSQPGRLILTRIRE
jgi:hypothetical protein